MFRTGANVWKAYDRWPPREAAPQRLYCARRRPARVRAAPADENDPGFDEYVSDPAQPVPYRPRPITPTYPGPEWQCGWWRTSGSSTCAPTC